LSWHLRLYISTVIANTLTREQLESFILLRSVIEVPSVCVISRYKQHIQQKLLTFSATFGLFSTYFDSLLAIPHATGGAASQTNYLNFDVSYLAAIT
jgi:hypothetical protein